MPDFANLLNVNTDEIKEQPVLPTGTYLARIGQFKFEEAQTKSGPKKVMNVPIQLTSAISVSGQLPPRLPEMRHTFWLTDPEGNTDEYTLDPIKKWCEACGIATSGRMLMECVQETLNVTCSVDIVHSPNQKNPERPYSNIKTFAKA